MIRSEISLFSKNAPGELGKIAALLADDGINIDAITVQDASCYVRELFKARGKALKRIASAASYNSMSKDSAEHALIRLLPAEGATNKAMDTLTRNGYLYDILPVVAVELENKPGELAKISTRLGKEGVNINYVYGSVAPSGGRCLFVFCPDDIEHAAKVFASPA